MQLPHLKAMLSLSDSTTCQLTQQHASCNRLLPSNQQHHQSSNCSQQFKTHQHVTSTPDTHTQTCTRQCRPRTGGRNNQRTHSLLCCSVAWFIPAARLLPAQHQRELPGLLMRAPSTQPIPCRTINTVQGQHHHRTDAPVTAQDCNTHTRWPSQASSTQAAAPPCDAAPLSLLHADQTSHLASPHTRTRVPLAQHNLW